MVSKSNFAPPVGFEPTTVFLTGSCATVAPQGNVKLRTRAIISRNLLYTYGI